MENRKKLSFFFDENKTYSLKDFQEMIEQLARYDVSEVGDFWIQILEKDKNNSEYKMFKFKRINE